MKGIAFRFKIIRIVRMPFSELAFAVMIEIKLLHSSAIWCFWCCSCWCCCVIGAGGAVLFSAKSL